MALYIDSTSKIIKRLKIEENGPAQAFLTQSVARRCDKYVPFKSGALAGTVIQNGKPTSNVEKNKIIYTQNYAKAVYKGKTKKGKQMNFNTEKHPHATSHWDKKMKTAEIDEIVKEVRNFIGGKK